MTKNIKKDLGALVEASPKKTDYLQLSKIISEQLYRKITSQDFKLIRSAKYDNNNKDISNNGSVLMVTLDEKDEEWVSKVGDVIRRFDNNNMNAETLSDLVVSELNSLDEEQENYLDDVTIISGYTDNRGNYNRLSILDNPSKGAELRFNLAFKLSSETEEDFIEEYNNTDSPVGKIFGEVDKFYYLGDEVPN